MNEIALRLASKIFDQLLIAAATQRILVVRPPDK
jgi:hypothetical protein